MTVDPFSSFNPINGMPVTIVFGTFNYRKTIRQWINYAALSCDHWRIICLDQELIGWLNKIGHSTCAVYFYDLFPDAPYYNLADPELKPIAPKIFAMRQKLFHALAKSGYDFIHSDADAFWLQDPRPWLMEHTKFDLLISQGLHGPNSHYARYHFTLCAGFFFCRANVRTQDYFRRVEETEWNLDQKSMNEVLLNDPKARWWISQPTILWRNRLKKNQHKVPNWYKVLMPMPYLFIWALLYAPRRWMCYFEKKLLWPHCQGSDPDLLNYICISPKIMKGRFSNRLTLGVIPMHLVSRIGHILAPPPWVVHIDINKKHKHEKKNA